MVGIMGERIFIKPPKGRKLCNLCGAGPITVVIYSRLTPVCLDEPCFARIMGPAYDGGPKKEESHDQNWKTSQTIRVLAARIASPPAPRPLTLREAIFAPAFPRTRERASSRIIDGGTYLASVEAWRLWQWFGGSLHGIGLPLKWPAGVVNEAVCVVRGHKTAPPHWGCQCGFWGMKDEPFRLYLAVILSMKFPHKLILGKVSLWGKVVVHEDGYRAQYAYPVSCFAEVTEKGELRPIHWRTAQTLIGRYGVNIGSPEEAALLLRPKIVVL